MPQDKIFLLIDGKLIEHFISYRIEADLYTADHAFSLELANPEIKVKAGMQCELHVNGQLELTGISDRVNPSYDKRGRKLKVEGRDLIGLLVDSCCEQFVTVSGMTLQSFAQMLLKTVPFINRKNIIYQENIRGNLKKKKGHGSACALFGDMAQEFAHIMPGQTIFEVLKTYSMSRGLMFFGLPDGTFVFGKPKDGGDPVFSLVGRIAKGKENNVIEGSKDENISKRFSKIIVAGQQQGTDSLEGGAAAINTKAVVSDPTFPFYKPYVAKDQNDSRSPKLHAQMLLEKMKHAGFQLDYKVKGHSQNGKNWTINEMCHVTDEALEIDGNYLIYGRTFEMSKKDGVHTTLRLGYPGMVQ